MLISVAATTHKQKAPLKTPDIKNDPMAAIYALSLGDFGVDSLMTADLRSRLEAQRAKRVQPVTEKRSRQRQDNPDHLRKQLAELVQIYSLDKTLKILGFDPDQGYVLYDSIASSLAEMFQADACHLFQLNHQDSGQDSLVLSGSSVEALQGSETTLRLHPHETRQEQGFFDRCMELTHASGFSRAEGTLSDTDGADISRYLGALPHAGLSTAAVLVAPLQSGQKRMGLLLLENTRSQAYGQPALRLADAAARLLVCSLNLQQWIGQAQHHLNGWGANASPSGDRRSTERHMSELQSLRAQLTESIADLGVAQQTFVEALAGMMDTRYPFMKGHAQKVAQTARQLAEAMGLNDKTTELVYFAGLLSTLGKLRLPPELLEKQATLSPQEWETLRQYPNMGVDLLLQIHFLADVIPYVHAQAERWNGSGGPIVLAGESIPLGARILAVADAYHAMRQSRPYRVKKKLSHSRALKVLQQEASTQWDPEVVAAMGQLPV